LTIVCAAALQLFHSHHFIRHRNLINWSLSQPGQLSLAVLL